MTQDESKDSLEKIAIIGIANAGKTSIIKVLLQEFEALIMLKPTQGIEYSELHIFSKKILIWDFGGQAIYRNKYLKAPERYLTKTKALFYVVDLQDIANIPESVNYFKIMFELLQKYCPDVKIVFLFNKSDPDYKNLEELNENKRAFLNGVVPTVDPATTQIYMYTTSIKNPFSIISAFSQTLFTKKDLYIQTSELLKSVVEMYSLGFAVLFSKDYFELGNSFSDKISITERNDLLSTLFLEYDQESKSIEEVSTPSTPFKLIVVPFIVEHGQIKTSLYLVLCYDRTIKIDDTKLKDEAEGISNNISKILGSSFLLD